MKQGNTGNIYYVVPEDQCFTRDDNWIMLNTGDGTALNSVEIEIWDSGTITQWDILTYKCDVDRLRVSLNHVIAYTLGKGLSAFYWRVNVQGTTITAQVQTIIEGQTLATRTHLADSVLIMGNTGDTIDLWFPYTFGAVQIGSTLHAVNSIGVHTYATNGEASVHVDLWSSVDSIKVSGALGIYDKTSTHFPSGMGYDLYKWQNPLDPSDAVYSRVAWRLVRDNTPIYDSGDLYVGKAIVLSKSSTPYYRGEYYDNAGVSPQDEWDLTLVYPCVKENKVVVEYYNIDGCKRYAVGQVLNIDQETEQAQYHRPTDELRSIPRAKTNRVTQTLRIGFPKVPHGAMFEDLLTSEKVVLHSAGADADAICKTTKLGKIDDSDVILEFVVLN